MEKTVKSIVALLSKCPTILDVGVGTGRFAKPIIGSGLYVVGADLSIPMMLEAREKGVRNLLRADAHLLPFRDRIFDAAVMVHLLHLAKDWVQVVHEVGRVTSRIIISVVGWPQGFRVRQLYLQLRAELGYPLQRLNQGEHGLRDILQPVEVRPVAEYDTLVNADDAITRLEQGVFAISWDLPENIHRKIIKQLRSTYAGKVFSRHDTVEIAVWTADQFRNLRFPTPKPQGDEENS